jgi:DNA processing protein
MALDQGREVMAVPGHPFDGRAGGCNALIRDGAILVRGAQDVIAALAGDTPAAPQDAATPVIPRPASHSGNPHPPERPLAEIAALHSQILDRLGPSPLAEDQLIRDIGHPAAVIAPELLALELDGRIARQAGGLLARVA